MPPPIAGELHIGGRVLDASRTWLVGVVNVTPDSFSDGGLFYDAGSAVAHGLRLAAEGADVLDVGGESTRPGAAEVAPGEQIRRVVPVIEGLAARAGVPLSVDTTHSRVARAAVAAGAAMVNDISGLGFDPEMAATVAELGVSLCVMHIQGTPRTMQRDPRYGDVVGEVGAWLLERVAMAEQAGVERRRICVDPGIGFGKRLEHNLALLVACGRIEARAGRPVLVGPSRKSFVGELTGRAAGERVHGTAAAVAASVLAGARLVRVHDVAAMRDVVLVADALARCGHRGGMADGQAVRY